MPSDFKSNKKLWILVKESTLSQGFANSFNDFLIRVSSHVRQSCNEKENQQSQQKLNNS